MANTNVAFPEPFYSCISRDSGAKMRAGEMNKGLNERTDGRDASRAFLEFRTREEQCKLRRRSKVITPLLQIFLAIEQHTTSRGSRCHGGAAPRRELAIFHAVVFRRAKIAKKSTTATAP